MSTTLLIWIVVVVAALLAVALVTGVVLSKRRRISLTETERGKPPVKGYQAGGGVTFAQPAGVAAPVEAGEASAPSAEAGPCPGNWRVR